MGGNKKVVYTCITNGYDKLKDPKVVTDGFDYICFTDDSSLRSKVWKIRRVPSETFSMPSPKKPRFLKINPHIILPEYDLSIWVDANINITGNLNEFLNIYCDDDSNIYVLTHPIRTCIYEEMRICAATGKDTVECMQPQIERYRKEGFPKDYGLLQSNIIIRNHNRRDCIRFMNAWWKEVNNGSCRDQLSFNYVAWKNSDIEIAYLDRNLYRSRWLNIDYGHNGEGPKSVNTNWGCGLDRSVEKLDLNLSKVEYEEIPLGKNGLPIGTPSNNSIFDKACEKTKKKENKPKTKEEDTPTKPRASVSIERTLRRRK